jgi:tyrosyl-tRNA synthetase
MTTDERFNLITRNLTEVLTEEDLRHLLESDTKLRHYIGFEVSGKLHIGHFFQLMKVKDIQEAGGETIIWLADLHSVVNDKLGGDLEIIKRMANEYFIPAMETLFECIGGDPKKLIFKLCSEGYAQHPEFWFTFLEMAKGTSLARSKRSITIMGREEAEDNIETAKIMYPIMQAADIFLLQANIAQAGMDQRKVHVVARDSAMQIKTNPLKDSKGNQIKPVAIHTPILLGLNYEATDTSEAQDASSAEKGDSDIVAMRNKMSKSKANSGITVHDTEDEIRKKINAAFAPEGFGNSTNNPLLNWTRYLIFNEENSLTITRPEKWGGDMIFKSYKELEQAYTSKELHPMDLKNAVADWLIETLEPARKYFEDPNRKAALEEIENLTSR